MANLPRRKKMYRRSMRSFSAGDRATIHFGSSAVPVEIVEDRGRVGHQGRHIMRVRVIDKYVEDPSTFEVSADELTPANSRD